MSRLAYFARETLISLRRNLMMTLAGIITVAVSLFLFGGIMLVQRLVDHGTDRWKNDFELEIYMEVDATQPQIDEVNNALAADPQVKSHKFLSKEDAYEEFKRIFRDQPALIESTTAEALPTSFRVAPTEAEFTSEVKARYDGQPGVDEIATAEEVIDRILDITRFIRIGFIALAVVLLASALFLIVNTIRLATFARRREIEVMKLVGASNSFVRVPFMAEGFVQGAIGAGFAVGLVYGLKVVLSNFVENREPGLWQGFYLATSDVQTISMIVLLVGALVGVVGSAIGLRRFLEV